MFVYDVKEIKPHRDSLNKSLALEKIDSRCLYLDEVIDVKFISAKSKYAVLCSNSESLKLLNMENGMIELYMGHTDIVLTLDVVLLEEDERNQ